MQRPPTIDPQRCAGCGRCLPACPAQLLGLAVEGYRKRATLTEPERCSACQRCTDACLLAALGRPQL